MFNVSNSVLIFSLKILLFISFTFEYLLHSSKFNISFKKFNNSMQLFLQDIISSFLIILSLSDICADAVASAVVCRCSMMILRIVIILSNDVFNTNHSFGVIFSIEIFLKYF